MSLITKTTWATTEINDRNLHKVKEEKFEAAAEEFLNELAHSYSDSRASFGVEGVIWARTMDVISE